MTYQKKRSLAEMIERAVLEAVFKQAAFAASGDAAVLVKFRNMLASDTSAALLNDPARRAYLLRLCKLKKGPKA